MRVLLFVLMTGAVIWALIECIQADDTEIRHLPKIWWILIILFFWAIGAVAWFTAGRPRGSARRGAPWPSGPTSGFPGYERPRPLAPDDDPNFLRDLKRSNDDHEQMLKRWEEDLKRRERDLRQQGDGQDPPDDPPRRS
jgi:hypothetical protein